MNIKTCIDCKEEKQEVDFRFRIDTQKYKNQCIVCEKAYHKKYNVSNKTKIRSDGIRYRDRNKSDLKLKKAQYYRDNKERISVKASENYLLNSDKIKARSSLNYLANREDILAKTSLYQKDNRGRYNAISARYAAAKIQATPSWSESYAITGLYEISSAISATGQKMHVDHIVPLQSKLVCGLHCLANLRIITAEANLIKSNKFEV